jgi:RDD family
MRLGPFELLRFGTPKVSKYQVSWPIESGLAAGAPGGTFRVRSGGGRLLATLEGYRPRVPPLVYMATQLPVHHLLTRLYLLRVRGRLPAPGAAALPRDRFRAGTVDLAFCLTLAGLTGRRRPGRLLAIAAAYHVVCWSLGGRTLGGLVTRQRVVAVDGSRLTPAQSLLRLAVLPASWFTGRPIHDEVAATEVIAS